MSFQTIAEPFIKLGIPVFPLVHGEKCPPAGLHWNQVATTDPLKIAEWDAADPDYNVGLAALPNGEFCFLEFDVAKGMSTAAAEMEQQIPLTRTQVSGKGFGHYIFKHTERSRALGNRSVNLPEGGEWFSFRADNKYLVGAGSLHPNGNYYQTARDIEPIPIPDWLCDYVEKYSAPPKPKACDTTLEVSDDFDFDDMMNFYGIGIQREKDDVWQVVEECPGVGYRHSGSTLTAFYWDGSSLGWSCFAQECPLHGKSIGQVIGFLNAQKGEHYKGVIWDREDEDESLFDVDDMSLDTLPTVGKVLSVNEMLELMNSTPKPTKTTPAIDLKLYEPASITNMSEQTKLELKESSDRAKAYTKQMDALCAEVNELEEAEEEAEEDEMEPEEEIDAPYSADYLPAIDEHIAGLKLTGEMKLAPEDLLPVPTLININDPEQHMGLEFPGDCALYGILGKKCKEMVADYPTLQMGWLYASELAVASTLGMEDDNYGSPLRVRSNLYAGLLGPVGAGKNVHMDMARASIFVPGEETFVEESPGSHAGLMLSLSEDEPLPRILFLDELINVFNACSIQMSQLPGMLCTLFNKDKTGGSVKKGKNSVYSKLSILGGLAISDPADFARVFAVSSVKGFYDRFLFGYATSSVRFRPVPIKRDTFNLNPVHFPTWVWDAKDEWLDADPSRNRVAELALRIALITAACNGDREITQPCLEAAFRLMEWQCRLRQIFKPGLAETKEAEALEAVWLALKEQYDKQKTAGVPHRNATLSNLSIKMTEEDRWKLIHYTEVLNRKSYYRRYGDLLRRVRATLIESGFISEVKEDREDDHGKPMAKGKTPFVVLNKNML
jgi:hypothetical protein